MEPAKLIRLPAVLGSTGLSRTALFKLRREGRFPSPVAIGGRAVAWSSAEVSAWIAARIAARDAGAQQ